MASLRPGPRLDLRVSLDRRRSACLARLDGEEHAGRAASRASSRRARAATGPAPGHRTPPRPPMTSTPATASLALSAPVERFRLRDSPWFGFAVGEAPRRSGSPAAAKPARPFRSSAGCAASQCVCPSLSCALGLAGAEGRTPTSVLETDALPIELCPCRLAPYSMILATTPAPTVDRLRGWRSAGLLPSRSGDQLDRDADVVARHHHLLVLRQLHRPGHVRRAEVELRTVVVEERRVTAALLPCSARTPRR